MLIVDDAVVIRKILTDVLSTDGSIEVVGSAANGKIALQKVPQLSPDVITMDVEMPDMNGIETLRELKKHYPKIPVIMFSTLTERGASATLDALHNGASDYVAKPANVGSVQRAREMVQSELITKIKALAPMGAGLPSSPASPAAPPLTTPKPAPHKSADFGTQHYDVVAIGTSTGGPNALAELIPSFPANFPVPVVITQHMPPLFTKMLAERLQSKGSLKVFEGADGMPVIPGQAYVAPGDFHMVFESVNNQTLIRLNKEPPENSCRPAVDPMLRSIVERYGSHTLAVILTGMGQDGMRGCEIVRERGGHVIAQDQATSVVWGMPGAVVERNLANVVLPLNVIGRTVVDLVQRSMRPIGVNI